MIIRSLLLAISILSVSACTSDRNYQRYFSKKDGTWDITELKWQRVESTITSQNITDSNEVNVGYLNFDESGTVNFSHRFGPFNRQGQGSWSVQDENLQIVYTDVDGGAPGTLVVSLRIDKTSPSVCSLQGTETWNDSIGNYFSNTLSYSLKRRN